MVTVEVLNVAGENCSEVRCSRENIEYTGKESLQVYDLYEMIRSNGAEMTVFAYYLHVYTQRVDDILFLMYNTS